MIESVTQITMPVGTTRKFWVPVKSGVAGGDVQGFFPAQDIRKNGNIYTLKNGFMLEDTDAGSISPLKDKVGIEYTHLQPRPNTIWFYAREIGIQSRIEIIGTTIHSHKSLHEGGPAYGTYYRELMDKT